MCVKERGERGGMNGRMKRRFEEKKKFRHFFFSSSLSLSLLPSFVLNSSSIFRP